MNTETHTTSFEAFDPSFKVLRRCMKSSADCWSRANRMQAEWFDLYRAFAQRELRSMTGTAQPGDWFAEQMRIFIEFGNRYANCSQQQMAALAGDYWELLTAALPEQVKGSSGSAEGIDQEAKTGAAKREAGAVAPHPAHAKPKPTGVPS